MRRVAIAAMLLAAGCGYKPGPEVRETRDTMILLDKAIKQYKTDVGKYPKTLNLLVEKPDAKAPEAKKWKGPYLKEKDIPKDAWGHDFTYNVPGKLGLAYDIISLGEDGKVGGKNDAQDIAYDDKSLGILKK